MDKLLFKQAIDKVYEIDQKETSIGILEEKTVHSVLKFYYGKNIENQEIKIDSYFADVKVENDIYEIQTRAFYKLEKKLTKFTRLHYNVNVVYPVSYVKWIKYLNEDFSYSPRRKSPRHGTKYDIIAELYSLRSFLKVNWVTFIIPLLEVEEIKLRNTIGKNHTNKVDRFPIDIIDEIVLSSPKDLLTFLPENLPEQFTSYDVYKIGHINIKDARILLLLLTEWNLVERIGMKGKSYIYKIKSEEVY